MLLTLIHAVLVYDRGGRLEAVAVDRVEPEEGVVLLARVGRAGGALGGERRGLVFGIHGIREGEGRGGGRFNGDGGRGRR